MRPVANAFLRSSLASFAAWALACDMALAASPNAAASTPLPTPTDTTAPVAGAPSSAGPDDPGPIGLEPPEEDDGAPFAGRVAAYLLSPEAGVAGLLFEDGREVHVPPNVGRRLVEIVKPGQTVQVGARPRSPEGPPAWPTITATDTGKSIDGSSDRRDDPPPPPPNNRGTALAAMTVAGTIAQSLHGPRGEKNGVRLTNGVQVSFPPRVAVEGGARLAPGRNIQVQGFGRNSTYGTAVQATSITPSAGPVLQVYGHHRPPIGPP